MNPDAPPFIFAPHPSHFYYFQSPLPVQMYYQLPSSFYCDRNNSDIALQFFTLSLNEQVIQQRSPPPPNKSSSSNILRGQRRAVSSMEFDGSKLDVEIRTTIMIKNIPNKFSRDMLMTMLDQHCAEENFKATMDGSPLSAYDFIYLPMDFVNECNLGYAFVNFTTPIAGWRLYHAMHHRQWTIFRSKKTSHICYARIQGREALIDNFRGSCFVCEDDSYLPAVLSPPRDGVTSLTKPASIGKRVYFGR